MWELSWYSAAWEIFTLPKWNNSKFLLYYIKKNGDVTPRKRLGLAKSKEAEDMVGKGVLIKGRWEIKSKLIRAWRVKVKQGMITGQILYLSFGK